MGTHKGSFESLTFHSRKVAVGVRMGLTGICMDKGYLVRLYERLEAREKRIFRAFERRGMPVSGSDSSKFHRWLMLNALMWIQMNHGRAAEIIEDLEITEKKGELSTGEANRNLLLANLPRESPYRRMLQLVGRYKKTQKLISSYLFPLLFHKRNKPERQESRLVRYRGRNMVFPTWFILPAPFKDDMGGEGGTVQARITAKDPAIQTFPSVIKKAITSRYRGEGCLVWMDIAQAELRAAGVWSGEPSLTFPPGAPDLHTERTVEIFGEAFLNEKGCEIWNKEHPVTKKWRFVGKTVNLADLFLSSPTTMHTTVVRDGGVDLPLDVFYRIADRRFEDRPKLFEWQKQTALRAQRQGYLEMPFTGESRYYAGFELDPWALDRNRLRGREKGDKRIHEIVNFPVQALAANMLVEVQMRLSEELPDPLDWGAGINMTHQVYDAIVLDVRRDREGEAVEMLRSALAWVQDYGVWAKVAERTGNTVPLDCDVEVTYAG